MTVDDLSTAMSRFDHAVQHGDRRAAEDVLHEDYALVLVHPALARMPRARWLEVLEGYVVHSYSVEQQSVDQSDDVAAVLSRVRMQATGGTPPPAGRADLPRVVTAHPGFAGDLWDMPMSALIVVMHVIDRADKRAFYRRTQVCGP